MFATIVATIGALTALIGVAVMAFPGPVRHLVPTRWSPKLIYGGIALRILIGVFFLVASDACSRPMAIGTLGVLTLVAGFSGLLLGRTRIEAMLVWVVSFPDTMFSAGALIPVLVGAFIVYAAVL